MSRSLAALPLSSLPRWFPLARKEARTVLTSKGTWLLAVFVFVFGWRPTYSGWELLGPSMSAGFVQVGVTTLVPLGVLVLSYGSVVGERTSGSLKFALGLPLTRTDVLVAKTVGRTAGFVLPVTVATVLLGVVGAFRYGLFSPLAFLGVLLATSLYLAVLVAIATAVSAVTTSTVRASGAVVGYFLAFVLLWSQLAVAAYSSLTGRAVNPYDPPADALLFGLLRLSPDRAYRTVTNWILGAGNAGESFTILAIKLAPGQSVNGYAVETAFAGASVPLSLHEVGGVVVLLAWLVVPLWLARYRFERGDLA
ncbi:ABC transporter permease [Halobacteria archaeon HArc-gm2]|nr:ABC transporter permease [Halobacteria archaeon HArc-gm2]